MRRRHGWITAAVLLAACGQETPTDVGGSLLPGDPVRTFEAILDADAFLVADTAFSGYGRPPHAAFLFIANERGGALTSRALMRFSVPQVISVRDPAGVIRPDSAPIYFAGRLKVRIDTLRSSPAPLALELFRATESWDFSSATWELRVDTAAVELPWAQSGGSPGARVGTGNYAAGNDTITIAVDSQTIAAWRDTANFVPGGVLAMATGGRFVRTQDIQLELDARSTIDTDTVVTSTVRPTDNTSIFDPPVGVTSATPRVGGIPVWRTFVRFLERLDTVTVACPDGPAGCRIALRDASISYAALMLEPMPPPAGFAPEDSMQLAARVLLVDPLVPLSRSPLGEVVGVAPRPLPPSRYVDSTDPIEVPVTEYLRRATADTAEVSQRPSTYLAVVTTAELGTFGFVAFAPQPRLRLLVTVSNELQLR